MDRMTLTVLRGDKRAAIPANAEESLLAALRAAGYTEPDAPCGGKGNCKKCLVTVSGRVRSVEDGAVHDAADETLLACRYCPAGECTVTVRAKEQMNVVTHGSGDLAGGGEGLGFAVDIGTTTVAAFLYDLKTGKRLGAHGGRNAQRSYGADVISRITCCSDGKLPEMRDAIRKQLCDFAKELCASSGRDVHEIRRASIAGNTVMEHLFTGLDPTNIGVAPFTPESLFGDVWDAKTVLPGLGIDAPVYLCPCVAGYVGGDITAGLLASGGDRADGLWLYIDIGTNGEMALGNANGWMSCATAAGPAFEGAEIACGMDGSPGAIDKVTAEDGDLVTHVIGEGKAVGLCGSGLIDAVSALLTVGEITEAGRMLPPDEAPEKIRRRVFRREDGTLAVMLQDGVFIAAQDIREVQLAKSAIRAGAETLLQLQGKTAADITSLVIAGGFGSFMDKRSALHIGLLPQVPIGKIVHVGNAAGAGAVLTLTAQGEADLAAFSETCAYLELSSSQEFNENYLEYMAFGED